MTKVIEQNGAMSIDRSAQLSGAGLKLVIADHRLDHGMSREAMTA
jgi:hypothetical protein